MASAAKSESVASARKMPLAAGSQSSGQEMRTTSPLVTSQAERNTSPAKVTARTAGIEPTVRAGKRARKSFTPQDSAATNPSKVELIGALVMGCSPVGRPRLFRTLGDQRHADADQDYVSRIDIGEFGSVSIRQI